MNQGRSEEIERIFERVDAALAVRTQGRYRSRCFVDRASIALALGHHLIVDLIARWAGVGTRDELAVLDLRDVDLV